MTKVNEELNNVVAARAEQGSELQESYEKQLLKTIIVLSVLLWQIRF